MRVREKEAFDGQISAAEMRNVEKFFPDKSMMTLIIIDSFTTTTTDDGRSDDPKTVDSTP